MYTKRDQEILAKKVKAVIYSVVPEEVLINKRPMTENEYRRSLKTCFTMYKYVQLFLDNKEINIDIRNQVSGQVRKAETVLVNLALEERRAGLRNCGFILVD